MKFDFKSKKNIVAVSTVAVVVLGVVLGVKIMLKSSVTNALKANSHTEEENKTTNDKKTLAESLKEKTDEGTLNKNTEDKNGPEDKDKPSQGSDKPEEKTEKEKTEKEKPKANSEDKKPSGNKNIKDIKVYDDQYIVKKGDTLYTIGRKFFVEKELLDGIGTIKKINTLGNSDIIKEGDKLHIPIGSNFDKKVDETTANNYRSYIVKKGDTLTEIAKEEMDWCDFNTGIRLLRQANNIVNDTIKENQKLIIPTKDNKNDKN